MNISFIGNSDWMVQLILRFGFDCIDTLLGSETCCCADALLFVSALTFFVVHLLFLELILVAVVMLYSLLSALAFFEV